MRKTIVALLALIPLLLGAANGCAETKPKPSKTTSPEVGDDEESCRYGKIIGKQGDAFSLLVKMCDGATVREFFMREDRAREDFDAGCQIGDTFDFEAYRNDGIDENAEDVLIC